MSMFDGLQAGDYEAMSRSPTTAPDIRRRKSTKKKAWAFLLPELWDELTYAARFATRVFFHTEKPETVSRNDYIEDLVVWGLRAYWKDIGGRPENEAEFEAKAIAHAAKIKAREAASSPLDKQ